MQETSSLVGEKVGWTGENWPCSKPDWSGTVTLENKSLYHLGIRALPSF